jgi:N-glycosylase/DNA lyase
VNLDIEVLKNSEVKSLVDGRIKEFKQLGKKTNKELFKELCFCILTANFSAERGIEIQKRLGNDFLRLQRAKLAKRLKAVGYRFPNTRAGYIAEARKYRNSLKGKSREWLVKNIKGLGYKEASHFLRNTGCADCAIIDFHIIDLLVRQGLIEKPKTITKKKYLEIEDVLKKIAGESKLNLAQLDLYMWYMETGKVLK